MSGVFKSSAGAMSQGGAALDMAARDIASAKAQLEAAYSKLQSQWQSSEARARADKEYNAVVQWLDSSIRWAQTGSRTTQEVNAMFANVERKGLA
jgi:hypothetical protein